MLFSSFDNTCYTRKSIHEPAQLQWLLRLWTCPRSGPPAPLVLSPLHSDWSGQEPLGLKPQSWGLLSRLRAQPWEVPQAQAFWCGQGSSLTPTPQATDKAALGLERGGSISEEAVARKCKDRSQMNVCTLYVYMCNIHVIYIPSCEQQKQMAVCPGTKNSLSGSHSGSPYNLFPNLEDSFTLPLFR